MEKQVISKKRVADHGEVLTGKREVNAMLDLVKSETDRIDSRFLEPACGTGNFLAEILERKLRVVEARYGKSQLEFERYAILAVSSIYGIDILEDNVQQCRQRLFGIFDLNYLRLFKNKTNDDCRESVRYILERNIIHGDALSLKTVGDNPKPIVLFAALPQAAARARRHVCKRSAPARARPEEDIVTGLASVVARSSRYCPLPRDLVMPARLAISRDAALHPDST